MVLCIILIWIIGNYWLRGIMILVLVFVFFFNLLSQNQNSKWKIISIHHISMLSCMYCEFQLMQHFLCVLFYFNQSAQKLLSVTISCLFNKNDLSCKLCICCCWARLHKDASYEKIAMCTVVHTRGHVTPQCWFFFMHDSSNPLLVCSEDYETCMII